jgi:hypothetical protein
VVGTDVQELHPVLGHFSRIEIGEIDLRGRERQRERIGCRRRSHVRIRSGGTASMLGTGPCPQKEKPGNERNDDE